MKLKNYFRAMYRIYITLKYSGDRFTCPICNGHFRKFLPFGVKLRPNARCPKCSSLERHRLLWLYLRDKTNFFTARLKVLDIAPMQFLQEKYKKLENINYISADISSPIAMIKMDVTNINLPDNQFDCIFCYHVLEHISNDRKAMGELFRVLKPGGWGILQSPVDFNRKKTFEDPSIVNPEDRERVFVNRGHVRIYGLDYKDRLEKAGFIVRVDPYIKELPDSLVKKYSLSNNEIIYFCNKPND